MTFFLSTTVISDIHNLIPPRTNHAPFPIHVCGVSHYRYLKFSYGYPKCEMWISATKLRLSINLVADIYNFILASHNSKSRYLQPPPIKDI